MLDVRDVASRLNAFSFRCTSGVSSLLIDLLPRIDAVGLCRGYRSRSVLLLSFKFLESWNFGVLFLLKELASRKSDFGVTFVLPSVFLIVCLVINWGSLSVDSRWYTLSSYNPGSLS